MDIALPSGWSHRTLAALRARLLAWFDTARRDLPWRNDRDPYRIWVSEVMLQQTTVAAVVPYFGRFLVDFPTLRALATAPESQVLKAWEGLGYYRRARNLHAAARLLVDHGGGLPDDPEIWSALPGVGRYILGAVLSQAFDRKLPIVEANSLRVLCRFFGYRGDPRAGKGKTWVWQAAEAMLPDTRPGDFNQAMMEIGALVCTPTKPACRHCPFAAKCVARREQLQEEIPPRRKPIPVVAVNEVAVVIRNRGRMLLCRRPANAGRWSNMWEVPHGECRRGEAAGTAAERIARDLVGLKVKPGVVLLSLKHMVTRFAIAIECLEAKHCSGTFLPGHYAKSKWLKPAQAAGYPVSSPQRKLISHLSGARSVSL